ncbi:hypothetical protein SAMN05421852_11762 [Thermoflavimicrobium dichotomicum]|uniref:Uncharacterized protein n=1 Tax=Thermoflavimicrobium dichotomicum TaxID=46223 RepID=A0A1I3TH75_9BACL|nr:hypothetical protein SAMN05421852_11762 [Thermoflavimicrobium dichotomicum]
MNEKNRTVVQKMEIVLAGMAQAQIILLFTENTVY